MVRYPERCIHGSKDMYTLKRGVDDDLVVSTYKDGWLTMQRLQPTTQVNSPYVKEKDNISQQAQVIPNKGTIRLRNQVN